jgi:hypothetical protein
MNLLLPFKSQFQASAVDEITGCAIGEPADLLAVMSRDLNPGTDIALQNASYSQPLSPVKVAGEDGEDIERDEPNSALLSHVPNRFHCVTKCGRIHRALANSV